jgi:hypothetical protein
MRRSLRESWSRGYFLKPTTGFYWWRAEYTRSFEPVRALAAETLKLERKFKAEG